jgi:hypothetical protein
MVVRAPLAKEIVWVSVSRQLAPTGTIISATVLKTWCVIWDVVTLHTPGRVDARTGIISGVSASVNGRFQWKLKGGTRKHAVQLWRPQQLIHQRLLRERPRASHH